jgi:ABC-type Fe3+-hydroxamate transport system substrate-binding protein
MTDSESGERVFIDQCGSMIRLPGVPSRIISLVPSQTELLYDLGLGERVVGITKYCIHPAEAQHEKAVVGGTKNFDIKKILDLQPDLVIGNKEENDRERIVSLHRHVPVWMSDIDNLEGALSMIRGLGAITGTDEKSITLSHEIQHAFQQIRRAAHKRVLYLIWKKPWMAAAGMTFINSMLTLMGLENTLGSATRYPEISEQQIRDISPEVIMLSSEPFPFQEKHIGELMSISPASKVMLVDGEMFSWYGSRLRFSPSYFNSLDLPRL